MGEMMSRAEIKKFQEIPNIGPAIEKNLLLLGLKDPVDLLTEDPYEMYDRLCEICQSKHDPCVIDVFISAVRYMQGASSQKWWFYTEERKQIMNARRV